MATVTWEPNANGDRGTGVNWTGDPLPGTLDPTSLTSLGAITVTQSIDTHKIAGLVSTNDMLSVTGGILQVTDGSTRVRRCR